MEVTIKKKRGIKNQGSFPDSSKFNNSNNLKEGGGQQFAGQYSPGEPDPSLESAEKSGLE